MATTQKQTISVALPTKTVAYLDGVAQKNGISRAEVLRWMLPIALWDHTTGKPVPPGPQADEFPPLEQSIRGAL